MYWPLLRFWRYGPLGWLCAAIWNVCEATGFTPRWMPFPLMFGVIMGANGRRIG